MKREACFAEDSFGVRKQVLFHKTLLKTNHFEELKKKKTFFNDPTSFATQAEDDKN